MKKYTVIFLLFYVIAGYCQILPEDDLLNKQIITSEMIKANGIVNISGLLLLADNWQTSTIDGFTRYASANSLSPYQRQNFIVMIDNQRFDINAFDVQNLDLLPVSINQIDFVEVINSPGIYMGEFTSSGLINIHTRKPAPGISAQFVHSLGDEVGDPGPYRYTSFASPNVDRLGYLLAGGISAGAQNWFMKTSVKHQENFDTDPGINNRISNLYDPQNASKLVSYLVEIGAHSFGGRHNLIAGFTTHNDFLLFKPYGNEIPVKRFIRHIGINGIFFPKNKLAFNYSFKYSANSIGSRINRLNYNFDWQLENFSVKAEASYNLSNLRTSIGLGYERFIAQTNEELNGKDLAMRIGYAGIDYSFSDRFQQSFGLYGVKNGNDFSYKVSMNNNFKLDRYNSFKTFFSASKRLPVEDNNYWTWYAKGYQFPKGRKPDYDFFGTVSPSNKLTADLIYTFAVDSTLSLNINGNFRDFRNFYIEKQAFQFSDINSSFYAPVEFFTGENLKTAGTWISINYSFSPTVKQHLFFNFQTAISGSYVFKEAWLSMPKTRAVYSIEFKPFDDFSIIARGRYFSSSKWFEYEYVKYQTNGKFSDTIKPQLLADLSFQKWFWSKRLWASLHFNNLFNDYDYSNPVGAHFSLRYHLQVHLYLDSIVR